jgi:hypothetical protein
MNLGFHFSYNYYYHFSYFFVSQLFTWTYSIIMVLLVYLRITICNYCHKGLQKVQNFGSFDSYFNELVILARCWLLNMES